jgi:hypothetical protein
MQSRCFKRSKKLDKSKKTLINMLRKCKHKETKDRLQRIKRTQLVKVIVTNKILAKTQISTKLQKFHRKETLSMMAYRQRSALMKRSIIKMMKINSRSFLGYLKSLLKLSIKVIVKKIKT